MKVRVMVLMLAVGLVLGSVAWADSCATQARSCGAKAAVKDEAATSCARAEDVAKKTAGCAKSCDKKSAACPKDCCGKEDCPKKDCPLRATAARAAGDGPAAAFAAVQAVDFANEMDKVSYVIGTQIGRSFKAQGMDIDMELLVRGMRDVLGDAELALTEEQQQEVMGAFQQSMRAKQQAQGAESATAGAAFLAANKQKEGVITLASGLQYKVVKDGTGATPTADDRVKTHYRGTLVDGTEFDSSYKRGQPATFGVKGVIAGWTEALQLMKEGAKWQLFIPAELAYGGRDRPGIPANSALVFDIELLEVVK